MINRGALLVAVAVVSCMVLVCSGVGTAAPTSTLAYVNSASRPVGLFMLPTSSGYTPGALPTVLYLFRTSRTVESATVVNQRPILSAGTMTDIRQVTVVVVPTGNMTVELTTEASVLASSFERVNLGNTFCHCPVATTEYSDLLNGSVFDITTQLSATASVPGATTQYPVTVRAALDSTGTATSIVDFGFFTSTSGDAATAAKPIYKLFLSGTTSTVVGYIIPTAPGDTYYTRVRQVHTAFVSSMIYTDTILLQTRVVTTTSEFINVAVGDVSGSSSVGLVGGNVPFDIGFIQGSSVSVVQLTGTRIPTGGIVKSTTIASTVNNFPYSGVSLTPARLYRLQDAATGTERYFSEVAPGDASYSDLRSVMNLAASSGVLMNSTSIPTGMASTYGTSVYSGEIWNCPMLGNPSAEFLSPLPPSYLFAVMSDMAALAAEGYGGYRNVSVWYKGAEAFCILFFPSSVPLQGAADASDTNVSSPTTVTNLPDAATITTGTQLNLAYIPTREFDGTAVTNNTLFALDVVDDQVRYSGGLHWAVPFKVIQQYDTATLTSIDGARAYATSYYPSDGTTIPNMVSDQSKGRVENLPVISPDGYDAHNRLRNTSSSIVGSSPLSINMMDMTAAPTSSAAVYNNINIKWSFLSGGGRNGRDSMWVEATVPFTDGLIAIGFGGTATESDIAAAAHQLYPNTSSTTGTAASYQSFVASSGAESSEGSALGGLFVVGYRLPTSTVTACSRQYYMSRTTGVKSLQEVTSANPINMRNFSMGQTRTTMTIRFVRDVVVDTSIPSSLGLTNATLSVLTNQVSKLFWIVQRDTVQLLGATGCATDISTSFVADSVSATGYSGGTVASWNGTDLSSYLSAVSANSNSDYSLSRGVDTWPTGFQGTFPEGVFTTTTTAAGATTTAAPTFTGVGSYTFSALLTVSWRVIFAASTTIPTSDNEIEFTISTPSTFKGWVAFGFGSRTVALADIITVYRNPSTSEVVVDDRKGIGSSSIIPRDANQTFTFISSSETEVVIRRRFSTGDGRSSAQPVPRDVLYQLTYGFNYLSGFAEGSRVISLGEINNGPTFSTSGFTQSAALYTFVNASTNLPINSAFQRDVIDVVPGQVGYSDLLRVITVQVPASYSGTPIMFKSDIPTTWVSDESDITTITRINCPVVHPSSDITIDTTFFPAPNITYKDSLVVSRLLWYRGNPLKCLQFPTAQNAVYNRTNEVYLLVRYGSNTTVIDTIFAVAPTNTSYFSPFCRVYIAVASIGYTSGTYKSKEAILAAHLDIEDTGVYRNFPMLVNETGPLPTVSTDSTPSATIDLLAANYQQVVTLHDDATALERVQLYWTYTDTSYQHVLKVMVVAYGINGYVSLGFSNSSYDAHGATDMVMGFINSATAISCVRVLRGNLPTAAPSGTPTLQIRNQQVVQAGNAVALLFERDFDGNAQESARIPTIVQGSTSRVSFATYRGFVSSSCTFDDYTALYHGNSPHGSRSINWAGSNGETVTTAPTSAPSQAFTSNDVLVATTIPLTPVFYRNQFRHMYCADVGTSTNLQYLASTVKNMALDGPAAKYNSQLPPAMIRLWNATSMTPWIRSTTSLPHPYIISDYPGGSPHYSGAWALYDMYLTTATDSSLLFDATTILNAVEAGSEKRLTAIVNCPIVHPDTKLAGDGLNSTYAQIPRVSLTLLGQPVTCLDFGNIATVATRHEEASKGGKFHYFDTDNLRVSTLYNFSVAEAGTGSIPLRPQIIDDLDTPFRRIVGINVAPATGSTYQSVEAVFSLSQLTTQDPTSATTRANTAYVGMVTNCYALPLIKSSLQLVNGVNVTVLSEDEGSYNPLATPARTITQTTGYYEGREVPYIRLAHPPSSIARFASPTRYGGFRGPTRFSSGLLIAAQAGLIDAQPKGVDPETGLPFVFVIRSGTLLSDAAYQTEMVVDVAPGMYRYADVYRMVVVDVTGRAAGTSLTSLSNITDQNYTLTLTNMYLNCPAVSSGSTLSSTPITIPFQALNFRSTRISCANFGTWSKANILPRSIIKVHFNSTLTYTTRTYNSEAARVGLFVTTPGSPAVGTNSNSTYSASRYSYIIRGRLDQLHGTTTTLGNPLSIPYSATSNPILSSFPSPMPLNFTDTTTMIQRTVLPSLNWNTAANPALFPQPFDPYNATQVYADSTETTTLTGLPALYTVGTGTTGVLSAIPGMSGYAPFLKAVTVQVTAAGSAVGSIKSMAQLMSLVPTSYIETHTVYSILVLQIGASVVSLDGGAKGVLSVLTSGGFNELELLTASPTSSLIVRNRNILYRASSESLAPAPIVFNASKVHSGASYTSASVLPAAPSPAIVYVFRRGTTVDSDSVPNQPNVVAKAPGDSTYHGSLGSSGHFDAWKVVVVQVPMNYTGAQVTSDVPFQTPANLPVGWVLNSSSNSYLHLFMYVNTTTSTMRRVYSPMAALLQTTLHATSAASDDIKLMCPETTVYYSGKSVVSLNCGFSTASINVSEIAPTTSTQLNTSAVVAESGVGALIYSATALESTNSALFDSSAASAMRCWASGRGGVCYNFSSSFPTSWGRTARIRNASFAGSEGTTARKFVFRNGPTLHSRHGLSAATAALRGTTNAFDVIPPVVMRPTPTISLSDTDVVELYIVNVFGPKAPTSPLYDSSSTLAAAEINGWPILYTGLVQTGSFTLTQSDLGGTLSGLEDSQLVYVGGSGFTHLVASTGDRTDLVSLSGSAAIAVTAPNGTFSHFVLDDLPQTAFARRQPLRDIWTVSAATVAELSDVRLRTFAAVSTKYASQLTGSISGLGVIFVDTQDEKPTVGDPVERLYERRRGWYEGSLVYYYTFEDDNVHPTAQTNSNLNSSLTPSGRLINYPNVPSMIVVFRTLSDALTVVSTDIGTRLVDSLPGHDTYNDLHTVYYCDLYSELPTGFTMPRTIQELQTIINKGYAAPLKNTGVVYMSPIVHANSNVQVVDRFATITNEGGVKATSVMYEGRYYRALDFGAIASPLVEGTNRVIGLRRDDADRTNLTDNTLFDSVPGDTGYTPMRQVYLATMTSNYADSSITGVTGLNSAGPFLVASINAVNVTVGGSSMVGVFSAPIISSTTSAALALQDDFIITTDPTKTTEVCWAWGTITAPNADTSGNPLMTLNMPATAEGGGTVNFVTGTTDESTTTTIVPLSSNSVRLGSTATLQWSVQPLSYAKGLEDTTFGTTRRGFDAQAVGSGAGSYALNELEIVFTLTCEVGAHWIAFGISGSGGMGNSDIMLAHVGMFLPPGAVVSEKDTTLLDMYNPLLSYTLPEVDTVQNVRLISTQLRNSGEGFTMVFARPLVPSQVPTGQDIAITNTLQSVIWAQGPMVFTAGSSLAAKIRQHTTRGTGRINFLATEDLKTPAKYSALYWCIAVLIAIILLVFVVAMLLRYVTIPVGICYLRPVAWLLAKSNRKHEERVIDYYRAKATYDRERVRRERVRDLAELARQQSSTNRSANVAPTGDDAEPELEIEETSPERPPAAEVDMSDIPRPIAPEKPPLLIAMPFWMLNFTAAEWLVLILLYGLCAMWIAAHKLDYDDSRFSVPPIRAIGKGAQFFLFFLFMPMFRTNAILKYVFKVSYHRMAHWVPLMGVPMLLFGWTYGLGMVFTYNKINSHPNAPTGAQICGAVFAVIGMTSVVFLSLKLSIMPSSSPHNLPSQVKAAPAVEDYSTQPGRRLIPSRIHHFLFIFSAVLLVVGAIMHEPFSSGVGLIPTYLLLILDVTMRLIDYCRRGKAEIRSYGEIGTGANRPVGALKWTDEGTSEQVLKVEPLAVAESRTLALEIKTPSHWHRCCGGPFLPHPGQFVMLRFHGLEVRNHPIYQEVAKYREEMEADAHDDLERAKEEKEFYDYLNDPAIEESCGFDAAKVREVRSERRLEVDADRDAKEAARRQRRADSARATEDTPAQQDAKKGPLDEATLEETSSFPMTDNFARPFIISSRAVQDAECEHATFTVHIKSKAPYGGKLTSQLMLLAERDPALKTEILDYVAIRLKDEHTQYQNRRTHLNAARQHHINNAAKLADVERRIDVLEEDHRGRVSFWEYRQHRVAEAYKTLLDVAVTVEGPYGGTTLALQSYDTLIIVAGGVGMASGMSLLETLTHQADYLSTRTNIKTVVVMWVCKYKEDFAMFASEIHEVLTSQRRFDVFVYLHASSGKESSPENIEVAARARRALGVEDVSLEIEEDGSPRVGVHDTSIFSAASNPPYGSDGEEEEMPAFTTPRNKKPTTHEDRSGIVTSPSRGGITAGLDHPLYQRVPIASGRPEWHTFFQQQYLSAAEDRGEKRVAVHCNGPKDAFAREILLVTSEINDVCCGFRFDVEIEEF